MEEVLVAGAGPVGLTAALELARLGQKVRIIDHNPARTQLSKAVAINARTLDLLKPSGVSERLLIAGMKIFHLNLRDKNDKPAAN